MVIIEVQFKVCADGVIPETMMNYNCVNICVCVCVCVFI